MTQPTTYELGSFDVLTKGDLKGYTNGNIYFKFINPKSEEPEDIGLEFLYRYDDEKNGQNHKLVSIRGDYRVPGIEDLEREIEKELKVRTEEILEANK